MGKHSRSRKNKRLTLALWATRQSNGPEHTLRAFFLSGRPAIFKPLQCFMKILGRYDRVDLPMLGLTNIHAKIDTGAYTSSLHCRQARVVDGLLEFILLDEEHPEFTGMKFSVAEFEERDIKNSFGDLERRFVIVTTLKIFNEEITTEFSLSNRGSLKFPILIGRKILRDRFLIDVKQKNVSYREKRRLQHVLKQKKN